MGKKNKYNIKIKYKKIKIIYATRFIQIQIM
jgi:hypothetical protein